MVQLSIIVIVVVAKLWHLHLRSTVVAALRLAAALIDLDCNFWRLMSIDNLILLLFALGGAHF